MGIAVFGGAMIGWLVLAVINAIVIVLIVKRAKFQDTGQWAAIYGVGGFLSSTISAFGVAWLVVTTRFTVISGDPNWGALFTSIAAVLLWPLALGLLFESCSALMGYSASTPTRTRAGAALHYLAVGAMAAPFLMPFSITFAKIAI